MPRGGPPKDIPDGYVCKACSKPGHWVYDCALKSKGVKRQRNEKPATLLKKNIDPKFREPTLEDIARAKEIMPVIKPSQAPNCLCGLKSSARKCRKKDSQAFGLMFWWCSKQKDDETRCTFSKRADVIPGIDISKRVVLKPVAPEKVLAQERGFVPPDVEIKFDSQRSNKHIKF